MHDIIDRNFIHHVLLETQVRRFEEVLVQVHQRLTRLPLLRPCLQCHCVFSRERQAGNFQHQGIT